MCQPKPLIQPPTLSVASHLKSEPTTKRRQRKERGDDAIKLGIVFLIFKFLLFKLIKASSSTHLMGL